MKPLQPHPEEPGEALAKPGVSKGGWPLDLTQINSPHRHLPDSDGTESKQEALFLS
ncbi:MAG: hypothetical protein ACFCUQ_16530 [Kiloniellales bacterium]